MGMYTEVYICSSLKTDTPKDALGVLYYLFGDAVEPTNLPAHDFFKCDRWMSVGHCSSYYHIPFPVSVIQSDNVSGQLHVVSRSDLKNYDNEISKFFDWIMPYLDKPVGEFIGYSRCEGCDNPQLYFKR